MGPLVVPFVRRIGSEVMMPAMMAVSPILHLMQHLGLRLRRQAGGPAQR
ncbi:hypothetical protein Mnod_7979 (plasmid) [Methylobacterium nodulans ORS 2060]|uniref:Uncharacterized protein n=1 Tax=Methylobacterium nodulans (strain LMG 21967 / CNCM I-2342 / ORS 2060) TaxID=460265 RepID=B8IWT9_METNO|nr:hypothetical protein Mnod_7979 [Methylobacterium nodulans ORS 2060]